MEINIKTIESAIVISLAGDIDGKTAPEVQQQIVAQIQLGGKILLDLSQVGYMSSAGLRMLLSTYRQVVSQKSALVLVGLSEEIKDTMLATGFLSFFSAHDTLETGLAALKQMR